MRHRRHDWKASERFWPAATSVPIRARYSAQSLMCRQADARETHTHFPSKHCPTDHQIPATEMLAELTATP
jgi:hypothetical protein